MTKVVEVWVVGLPYPLRTKNVVRTVKKLEKKGYKKEMGEIFIVEPFYGGYRVYEYSADVEAWMYTDMAVHPVTARKHNILNAYGASSVVGTIEDVQKFINEEEGG